MKFIATISYIVIVVFVNSMFSYLPNVTFYGKTFSAADFLVGSTYVVRDFAQREIKHYVILAMLAGGVISYIFAAHEIAIASIVAFALGETVDWLLFTFTKKPLSQRLLWSASISAPLDSWAFLMVSHRFSWFECIVMTLFKMAGILALWYIWRVRNRQKASPLLA